MKIIFKAHFLKPLFIGLLMVTILTSLGCVKRLSSQQRESFKAKYPNITIEPFPSGDGFYAKIQRVDSGWKLLSIRPDKIEERDDKNQEILFVSDDLTAISPAFYRQLRKVSQVVGCQDAAGLLFGGNKPKKSSYYNYDLCTSDFSKLVGSSCAPSVAGGCGASSSDQFVLDENAIIDAAIQTDLISAIKSAKAEKWHQQYLEEFSAAQNSSERLINFTIKYAKNDPDSLVPGAKERIPVVEQEEAKKRQRRVAIEIERSKRVEIENKRRQSELANFRKSIAVGTETNCGPVLEKKGPLVKVYFPVMNFGTEHWIRAESLSLPGRGCEFYNGRYIPNDR